MAGGGSGGNSYWPGFVDALTNVVIAMIFVVVVPLFICFSVRITLGSANGFHFDVVPNF